MIHVLLLTSDVLAVVPNPTAAEPPGFGGINTILTWIKWACYIACLVGLLGAAGAWALDRFGNGRGGGGDHVQGIVKSILAAIVVGAAGLLINTVAT